MGFGFEVAEEIEGVVEGGEEGAEAAGGREESVARVLLVGMLSVWRLAAVVEDSTTYLFMRRITRSGVAAYDVSVGALFFASAATDFSDAGGILVAPSAGAPGSAAGSDIMRWWWWWWWRGAVFRIVR